MTTHMLIDCEKIPGRTLLGEVARATDGKRTRRGGGYRQPMLARVEPAIRVGVPSSTLIGSPTLLGAITRTYIASRSVAGAGGDLSAGRSKGQLTPATGGWLA